MSCESSSDGGVKDCTQYFDGEISGTVATWNNSSTSLLTHGLVQTRYLHLYFCEHSNEPLGSLKKAGFSLTAWVTIDFSKTILHHGISYGFITFWIHKIFICAFFMTTHITLIWTTIQEAILKHFYFLYIPQWSHVFHVGLLPCHNLSFLQCLKCYFSPENVNKNHLILKPHVCTNEKCVAKSIVLDTEETVFPNSATSDDQIRGF